MHFDWTTVSVNGATTGWSRCLLFFRDRGLHCTLCLGDTTRSTRAAATRSAQASDNGENSKNGDECLGEICWKYDCSLLDRKNILPANRRPVSPL
jgi:hypothetical protein